MQITIYSIQKGSNDFNSNLNEYIKMSTKFAKISQNIIFNERIAKAQTIGKDAAIKAYDEAYLPYIGNFSIALDESGEMLDSYSFAKLFNKNGSINFFIGGAYGLSSNFKNKCNKVVSLSPLTMAHKIAKLVLFEQIYRSLCINAGHPYHK